MNYPRSIFTAPKALRRRSSESESDLEPRPVPSDLDLIPASPPQDERPLWHGRALPKAYPWDPQPEASQATQKADPNRPQTPVAAGLKRPLDERDSSSTGNKDRKKPRRGRPSGHKLDPLDFPLPTFDKGTPPSPLFFSNSPQPRPPLPPRFSSSEAAAKMLSKTRGEDAGIKTVTLARGTPTVNSPPPTRTHFRPHLERRSASEDTTPDTPQRSETLRLLGQVGITELLDQDERPTFIVDLQDPANYDSSTMNIVYANSALRANPSLLDSIKGKAESFTSEPISFRPFSQFKAWVFSAIANGESLDVCLPSFILNSMTWSCATLRKRMRIISGLELSMLSNSGPNSISASGSSRMKHAVLDSTGSAGLIEPTDPQDYFGPAGATMAKKNEQSRQEIDEVVPSIEMPSTGHEDFVHISSPNLDIMKGVQNHPSRVSSNSPSHHSDLDPDVITDLDLGDGNAKHSPDVILDEPHTLQQSINLPAVFKEEGFFDWTRLPVSDAFPEHIQFARSLDWASTALGPIETWSADLRQMCNLIMASPHPAAMYWGEDLVAIYNEAYVLLAGQKHPALMGQSYRDAWAEIWDEVKDVFANAQTTGQATMKDDDCLFIKRTDYLEETYFSWSIIPIVGGDGSVVGLYNPAFEKTRRKIAERRMLTLREVGERTATARDVKRFWAAVLDALECNEYDTPFVLLYSLAEETDSDDSSVHSSSISGTRFCNLEGALGVPAAHEAAPEAIDLKSGTECWATIFREVMKTNKPKLLDITTAEDFPPSLLDGLEWRGFGDPAKSVVVCPIHPTTGESTLGFLIMGINPRRPYDGDYDLFVQLLSRQLATSLASVVLFEEEIKRGQRAAKLAALDRIQLSEQLAARTEEAIESENKFSRMAEFAPVGIFIADSQGRIAYCNDTWYEICRIPKEVGSTDRWMDFVSDVDKTYVEQLWRELVDQAKPTTAEFRFKAPWMDRTGTSSETWVLFSAYPEKRENGTLKSVFGSMTNISQQKWAEGFQKRKMEEAIELKRQQENFIDITSHEMRNPLSAILQCADEIVASLSNARTGKDRTVDDGILDDNIDAAQTIALCAQHQKRIVDDVLTLSKLDSALLVVTPVDVQPLAVVQRALKMFESELQTSDIQMDFIVDPSLKKLDVDWVRFDPSRVLQVLINLMTNAIKFTTTQSRRVIKVIMAATNKRPDPSNTGLVDYFPTRSKRVDMTEGIDWGDGQELFIHFTVQDTGRGLTSEEKKLLFQRFSQTNPRTHVQYGGSGLGLFISRELTELQGGEIGVNSESGKGSTFAFYVKARRSTAPNDSNAQFTASLAGRRSLESKAAVPGLTTMRNPHEPLKILIVEDNLVNQKVLQKQLKNLGAVTHVANHGGEAIERLRESNFWAGHGHDALELSVVLMDQEMPVMDGLTCTKKIREMEQQGRLLRHVPIIAVTANARSEQIQTALEAGMDDVVSKPFKIPELMPKIEELLSRFTPPTFGKA